MAFLTQIAEITDYLFLSSATAITRQRLSMLGITHVINCTLDVPNLNVPGIQCSQIHVDDHPSARLDVHFDRVADEIGNIASRGGKVIVHCVAGVSRSATLCIVHLMKYQRMTLQKAHEYVKKRRHMIRPNMGFWRQLIEYERKLYGRNTVRMVSSSIGLIPDVYKEQARHSDSYQSRSQNSLHSRNPISYNTSISQARSPISHHTRNPISFHARNPISFPATTYSSAYSHSRSRYGY